MSSLIFNFLQFFLIFCVYFCMFWLIFEKKKQNTEFSQAALFLRNFAGCEISQPANFHRLHCSCETSQPALFTFLFFVSPTCTIHSFVFYNIYIKKILFFIYFLYFIIQKKNFGLQKLYIYIIKINK